MSHCLASYALTCHDMSLVRKFQNEVQRSFIRSNFDLALNDRWRDLHHRLRELRGRNVLPDLVLKCTDKYRKQSFDRRTMAVLRYRDSTWATTHSRDKPRRRAGKPPLSLLELQECLQKDTRMFIPAQAPVLGQPSYSSPSVPARTPAVITHVGRVCVWQ